MYSSCEFCDCTVVVDEELLVLLVSSLSSILLIWSARLLVSGKFLVVVIRLEWFTERLLDVMWVVMTGFSSNVIV